MKKIWLWILLTSFFVLPVSGQIQTDLPLPSESIKKQGKIPRKILPAIDIPVVKPRVTGRNRKAYRFAYLHKVSISPENTGVWQKMPDDGRLWQASVVSEGAYSLNLTFGRFRLPEGARLFVYAPDKKDVVGALTSKNNKINESLAVRPVAGDEVIIEYYEPGDAAFKGELLITRIGHDYRNAFGSSGQSSQYCEVNVNCPEGDEWQVEKRSVAKIVIDNVTTCTGALINNTKSDGTPYFYTANHCVGDDNEAGNTVFFFNYESDNCTGSSGSLAQSLSGAALVATAPGSKQDFSLLQLSETPPAEYLPYYAGWDRSGNPPESSVTIHHPDGDVKKISIDEDAAVTANYGSGYDEDTHWLIRDWEVGATEGGSSGAPLFNEHHLLVGDLTGGVASCDNPVEDYYAKFHNAWDDYEKSNEQLRHWLDPDDTGVSAMHGYNPYEDLADYDARILSVAAPKEEYCNSYTIVPEFKIQNRGVQSLTELIITYWLNDKNRHEIVWEGNLSTNQSEIIKLDQLTLDPGSHSFHLQIGKPNGENDENSGNNERQVDFNVFEGVAHSMDVKTDEFGFETTWELRDNANNVLYSGGPYTSNNTFSQSFCLETGCYTFVVKDKAGDGLCCNNGEGFATVFNPVTGDTLAFMDEFNSVAEQTFCVDREKPAYDIAVAEMDMKATWCQGSGEKPVITVANRGRNAIERFAAELEIGESVLKETVDVDLKPGERIDVEFDSITIYQAKAESAVSQLLLHDQQEETTANNTMEKRIQVVEGRKMQFKLLTDDFGSETSWELMNDDSVLFSGGPYKDNVNRLIEKEFCLPLGCYRLKVYDALGDGVCCGWSGDGYFELTDASAGGKTVARGDEFGSLADNHFCIYPLAIKKQAEDAGWKLYPNPAQKNYTIETGKQGVWVVNVFSATGGLVDLVKFKGRKKTVDASELQPGIYFIQLSGNGITQMRKLIITP